MINNYKCEKCDKCIVCYIRKIFENEFLRHPITRNIITIKDYDCNEFKESI